MNSEEHLQQFRDDAQVWRVHVQALEAEGFTRTEALQLLTRPIVKIEAALAPEMAELMQRMSRVLEQELDD